MRELLSCELCPRKCRVNRNNNTGYCGVKNEIKLAKAFLHMWEEPCISGVKGSGTIFFSNCNLGCIYCQNYKISHGGFGKVVSIQRLSEIMVELQDKGAENINLVTPTPYIPFIREAIIIAKEKGLKVPIIYNTSGYDDINALASLEGLIDIYLPDIKYFDTKYGIKYSNAQDYFKYASSAVLEMHRQVGNPIFDDNGILLRGVMIRHMMLPGLLFDSKKIIDWTIKNLPQETYLNLMCQYTPMHMVDEYTEINKKINKKHYEKLIDYAISEGLVNGFIQDFESAKEDYVPDFNLEGI